MAVVHTFFARASNKISVSRLLTHSDNRSSDNPLFLSTVVYLMLIDSPSLPTPCNIISLPSDEKE